MAEYMAYIGTYSKGENGGIFRAMIDSETGDLRVLDTTDVENPSHLALAPDGKHLYAALLSAFYIYKVLARIDTHVVRHGLGLANAVRTVVDETDGRLVAVALVGAVLLIYRERLLGEGDAVYLAQIDLAELSRILADDNTFAVGRLCAGVAARQHQQRDNCKSFQ